MRWLTLRVTGPRNEANPMVARPVDPRIGYRFAPASKAGHVDCVRSAAATRLAASSRFCRRPPNEPSGSNRALRQVSSMRPSGPLKYTPRPIRRSIGNACTPQASAFDTPQPSLLRSRRRIREGRDRLRPSPARRRSLRGPSAQLRDASQRSRERMPEFQRLRQPGGSGSRIETCGSSARGPQGTNARNRKAAKSTRCTAPCIM